MQSSQSCQRNSKNSFCSTQITYFNFFFIKSIGNTGKLLKISIYITLSLAISSGIQWHQWQIPLEHLEEDHGLFRLPHITPQ